MTSRRDVIGIMVSKGNHPQMVASFSYFHVNYYNSGRLCTVTEPTNGHG